MIWCKIYVLLTVNSALYIQHNDIQHDDNDNDCIFFIVAC